MIATRAALTALDAAYAATLVGSWLRFRVASHRARSAQETKLSRLLAVNAASAFGTAHGFDTIDSAESFQRRVPISDYEIMEPWIERAWNGESSALTAEPVVFWEKTSGTRARAKRIPFTRSLLREVSAATGPWILELMRRDSRLLGTQSYWSISPVARSHETSPSGIPVGIEDDTEYFGRWARWALAQKMAVPSEVRSVQDISAWRTLTLKHLLASSEVGLISVWSPTFLVDLMSALERGLDDVLAMLTPARSASLRRALDRAGRLTARALWPRLRLVSCWTDGSSSFFVGKLDRWFSDVQIQPKGLIATEGVLSIPFGPADQTRRGAVAAITSHFLEFVDLNDPNRRPRLADQLQRDAQYEPLLTTAGGLYRYRLGDVVRCTGHFNQAPLLRFMGRLDRASDMCGEKLGEHQVAQALHRALERHGVEPRLAMLIPLSEPTPRYAMLLDSDAPPEVVSRLVFAVDEELCGIYQYRYCRELGQLGPVRAVGVRDGWNRYERAARERGVRGGDIKPLSLDPGSWLREVFAEELAS